MNLKNNFIFIKYFINNFHVFLRLVEVFLISFILDTEDINNAEDLYQNENFIRSNFRIKKYFIDKINIFLNSKLFANEIMKQITKIYFYFP